MRDKIIVYQSPPATHAKPRLRCSGRAGEEFEAVNYYKALLTAEKLRELLVKLDMSARDILRSDEPIARSIGLAERNVSNDELIRIMVENPDLMQRPIVVRGDEVVLYRPAENVKKLLTN